MNFIDAYDITGPVATSTREGPEPTLNEEVNEVVGQLSRFWGGFRKQSQTVLETARKDLTQAVSNAQKELTKLTAEPETGAGATTDGTPLAEAVGDTAAGPSTARSPSDAPSSSSEDTQTTPTGPRHNRSVSVSATAQNLFSRLHASLPADLASTVQAKLPESIKQGAGSIDFAQLRTTLTSEFYRVQDITRTQAEEYAHKSEELLRDAGEFLKDAVKVVPPESGTATPGVLWDGTDIWMLPDMAYTSSTVDSKGKGKEKDIKSSAEGLRAVATRAEALLKQLRSDPEVVKADPEADEKAAQMWKEWCSKEIGAKDGGIDNPDWLAAVSAALADPADGAALQKTVDTLVPSVMSRETFWTRYFFRVYQVESEERRRKALLQGTVESEEDFDWESEDEESVDKSVTPQARAESLAESTKTLTAVKSVSATSGTNSRVSSEDGSYDVVSSQVSSNAGDSKPEHRAGSDDEEEEDTDDGEDEDSEEEEDEDDEEDEEDEEEERPRTQEPKTKAPARQAKEGDDDDDSDWE